MKILIATPLYPPDIGGPAKYAQAITGELAKRGIDVSLAVYSAKGKFLPPGLRHAYYFLGLLRRAWGADFIFTLDTWSAGMPALFAAALLRKKLVVRIGGDFLWESYVDRTGELIKLSEFYTKPHAHRFTLKEWIVLKGTGFFLRHSDVLLFNTLWQHGIWHAAYGFSKEKSRLLENQYAGAEKIEQKKSLVHRAPVFVSAVRGTKFKNLSALGRVFARLKKKYPHVLLDTRPLSPEQNKARLASCYVVVIPSISEINPNTVWEALSFGKPFICPLDSGCRDKLRELGLFVDTSDPAELERAFEVLLDKKSI